MNNKMIHMVALVLLLIGGLNWGLVGIGGFVGSNWNVVNLVLGGMPALEWIVYVLVGLAAIYEAVTHKTNCMHCSASGAGGGMPAQEGNM